MAKHCIDCKDRKVGCHSYCMHYIKYRKKKDKIIKERMRRYKGEYRP